MLLTKDKAYLAAGKIIEQFTKKRGAEKSKLLDEHFKTIWDDHDEHHTNTLEIEEGMKVMQDIVEAVKEWVLKAKKLKFYLR